MNKKYFATFLATGLMYLATPAFAETAHVPQVEAKNQLPDNPSLGRVLLYKTGKTITRIGDATQRGAEKTSNAIQRKWDDSKVLGNEAGQAIEQKSQQVQDATAQKWQQTKEVVTSTRPAGTNVPIEQGSLSQ
ncbi:hypothetical protein [Acinetobacter sp. MD2]|uniref:hypothetical protein n=1 Tax=Acinetobacter sp. MD2 TaxID=2600066 RepID=UPI002D1F5058|nr:hypothetical protein [Acinetobacter sp. MD2]MEB3767205.1 hypothetical protein [Acinetobacter sp. MD2]